MASRFVKITRAYGNRAAIELDKAGLEWLSRKVPREGWTKNDVNEIQLQFPVTDLNKDEIHMLVDTTNKLLLRDKRLDKLLHIQELPLSGNFEKAQFQSTMEDGLLTVNIKNFRRNDVQVKLPHD